MKKIFVLFILLCCISSIKSFACQRQTFVDMEHVVPTIHSFSRQIESFYDLSVHTEVSEYQTQPRAYQVLGFSKTEDVPVDMAADIATFTKIVFTYWFPFVENSDAESEQYLIAQKNYVIPNLLDKPVVYQTFLI